MARRRRRVTANFSYLAALLGRFKLTLLMLALLFGPVPLLYCALYVGPQGEPLRFGQALHHVYFLLFGQPSLPYVDLLAVEVLNIVIPPLGIVVVADGVVRFAYLFFAKHRSDKEWIEVISKSLKDHVIVCGAGRVGYRVTTQLLALDREVVVIEKNEDAAFARILRDDLDVPVLIDDIKSHRCLERTNVHGAAAIVCATDDDLANLNVALDARRLKPEIRVVMRLFDDDLVAKVRDTFKAEALSSSALAAPVMALAALDPRIVHSFQVGKALMVVSQFVAQQELSKVSVAELRDRFGGLTLSLRKGAGEDQLHPAGETRIAPADVLMVQCAYPEYLKLRDFTHEATPPLALAR